MYYTHDTVLVNRGSVEIKEFLLYLVKNIVSIKNQNKCYLEDELY